MSTPFLHLETLFRFDSTGRITGTREPDPSPGPKFALIRGRTGCTWGVRADVPLAVAKQLDDLAKREPPTQDLWEPPVHSEKYITLLHGEVDSGPAFEFPEETAQPHGAALVKDIQLLEPNFSGWTASEIPGRSPVVALFEDGLAVSICFCARRFEAAEAGLETAAAYRGRGLGPRVAAAWAMAVRASGRTPLYSTSWSNGASLTVARKLGLKAYASAWSIS